MKKINIAFLLVLSLCLGACTQNNSKTGTNHVAKYGKWSIDFDFARKVVSLKKGSELVAADLYASYKMDGRLVTTKDYSHMDMRQDEVSGGGDFKIIYLDKDLPVLTQHFYVFEDKDYILTDFTLEDATGVASNYMAPVCVDSMPALFEKGDNRALFIPFDNDKWIRFQSYPASVEKLTSYEVTAIFNNASRNGLVIGSVEHDNWKTAIDMVGSEETKNIKSLVCYGGVANETTRDAIAHGTLKGKKIKSPKVMVGLFDDWRNGMETYADVNAELTPPRAWDKAVPFGWNSWGVLQFKLTYDKAIEVSDFFKNNLQNNNFSNSDKLVYVGLDSGWNSFTEKQLKTFVQRCKDNGQIAGVYWTPFTDWGKNAERTIQDAPDYKFKDIYLYANGEPQDLDGAYAIDPTHPAIEQMMKKTSDLFHRCGFEYVKMDFMTHGALEADNWYNPQITTGIQAYNYGMKLLDKYFGDMYINLSISPIFPSQYAQSRRIACDAWNKIKDTEYSMNALSYGWWIDRIYQFNDADHIVLQKASEGENRARVTSGVITGLYIAGDDFSKGGSKEGKEKARKFLTNSEVNAVAKGNSFRPL
ncbi:MAG: hypothetical protein JKX79_06830, partial [Labilibaculum sp.]|nr:hypothetical protein [Labilibaculum sp.]